MVLIDGDYKCTYVDLGCQGSMSDREVVKNCELYKLLASNQGNIQPLSTVNSWLDLNVSFLLQSNCEVDISMMLFSLPLYR